MKFEVKRLSPKEIDKIRIELARLTNIPSGSFIINQVGRFEIYNITEGEFQLAFNKLRNSDLVYNIGYTSRPDFGHFDFRTNKPKMKYTINGYIK